MSKSSEKIIGRKTEKKLEQKTAPATKQTKKSEREACAEDALMCPCFPHINIEDHITGKPELTK